MISVTEYKNHTELSFPYNPHLIDEVKAIPGRKFNYHSKTWSIPRNEDDKVKMLVRKYGSTQQVKMNQEDIAYDIPELPDLAVEIPLKMDLFPYQRKGVAYALEKKRLIVGDQPGLGKTAQAIATIVGANKFPCLVICPSSLKINWEREWKMWSDKKVMILEDRIKNTWPQYFKHNLAQVFIVNYESLKKYFVQKMDKPTGRPLKITDIHFSPLINLFESVIIDEVHRCKDPKTQQAKFVRGLSIGKEYVLALTGTPVVNKPKDLIAQLGIIDRLKDVGGYQFFMNRYCGGDGRGAFNLKELNYKLNQHCFYRRDKSEVLKDLPDKMRQVMLCEINNRYEYNEALNDLEDYLKKYKAASDEQIQKSMKGEIMVRIGILKNISARGKLNDVFEFVSDILEEGEKLVLFCHLKEVASKVMERFPEAVSIRGDDDMQSRQVSVDRFQNDPGVKLIVCSIKAAGVGITLTAASRVAFIELGWHPADMEQCEDRCHRIGQKDSVQCIYFLGKGTIDEKIYKLIDDKREVANTITGAKDDVEVNIIDKVINLFSV